MSEWISVEDMLPSASMEIIADTKRNGVTSGYWLESTRHYKKPVIQKYKMGSMEFTHWMELPKSKRCKQ